jgi:hypothetical protein
MQRVDREAALSSRAALAAEGGPSLDLASAMTLVAAERLLDAGLSGHARIVVPMGADAAWDGAAAVGLRDARVDADIAPSLAELERALTA